MAAETAAGGHAPNGLLNENSRGSISAMVKPETGQANLEEKRILRRLALGGAIRKFDDREAVASSSAVSKLSASRLAMSGRTTSRSTTTSMSCLSFLSSAGASAIS